MSEKKLLTVSIAAYNVEKYIERAISSCLSIKEKNLIEVLIIDDGSVDSTNQIAKQFEKKFPNIIHVIKKENGGYGSTINAAIPIAHGKYFKLLDSDDWFDKNGLNMLISQLQKVDVDMVVTPYKRISEKSGKQNVWDYLGEVKSGEYPIDVCLGKIDEIPMHCVTFKTQMLRLMNINLPEHCFYTDTEFVYTALSSVKNLFVSHTPVYCYCIGREEQSMSITGIREHFDDHGLVLKDLFSKYDSLSDKGTGNAEVMYATLKRECYGHYRYYCLLKINRKNKKALQLYDQKLKIRRKLYDQIEQESKIVLCLRKTRFLAYPLICMWIRLKKEF